MFFILFVIIMKYVNQAIINRAAYKDPKSNATTSTGSNNSSSSGHGSATSSSNSSSKENYDFGGTQNNKNSLYSIAAQYVQKLRWYKHLQEQRLMLLQRELHRRQLLRQQGDVLKQHHNILRRPNEAVKSTKQPKPTKLTRPTNWSNGGLFRGPKSRRGMTEFSTNENQKSLLPQLNHNSSPHLQHIHQSKPPSVLPISPHSPKNYCNHHNQQHQQQHQQQQQQHQQPQQNPSNNHYKRPLTSPNNSPYNNFYGHVLPLHHSNTNSPQQHQLPYGWPPGNPYLNDLLTSNDELTDECLKKNVQIVLNNLDRYNNALRSIILNEQVNGGAISILSSGCSSFNNNLSNLSNMAGNLVTTPESDYNSNATTPHHGHLVGLTGIIGGGGGGGVGASYSHSGGGPCSIASSHDFTHDNSDYQWFLDYGYRDGVAHQSVLSSLSASYNGIGELSYYDDLAKNIDANLAEVDMENFRTEDIHSLLSHIPTFHQHHKDVDKIENSICKSELLFSPVKESHISIDSLDLDSYPDDGDMILTCKANKDNYTIAFEEGSIVYSDESFYAEPSDIAMKNKQNFINLHSNLDDIVKRKSLEVSMSRSDHAFTTWSKLKKNSTSQLQRYPSGNNNTSVNIVVRHAPHCTVRKSASLPNLRLKKDITQQQLNVSQALCNSTMESCKSRNLLPMCQMPISTASGGSSIHFSPANSHHDSSHADMTTATNSDSEASRTAHNLQTTKQMNTNQPAFNLVKLFIKQKSSCSSDTTCMDISSGCWPSSEGSSSLEQRMRKKSMNDSGKGSALSRHDEEEDPDDSNYQLDSLDICDKERNETATKATPTKKIKNDLYREVFELNASPPLAVRKPLKNPHVQNLANNQQQQQQQQQQHSLSSSGGNNNNSSSEGSHTSENLTQVYNGHRSERMKLSVEMITRSMQTSSRDRFRFVPPSFLAKLNTLGEEKQAPIYVIYPNYALPDLGFVKTNTTDVIFSPFNYKNAVGVKKRSSTSSVSEDEILKNVDYKHVVDWKSLATLLPAEYRRRLKHIPEVDVVDLEADCSMKPLFCMTPPIRRNNRANICDCAQYFQMGDATGITATTACTSSSGSSQPPSSGYRGSSTLLTDSEFDTPRKTDDSDPLKNMYVYQYENNRMDGGSEERLSARTPRGILRKTPNRQAPSVRAKRSSLIEDQKSNVRNLEKRRSLQEPSAYFSSNDDLQNPLVEDYLAEMEEYYDELHSNLNLTQGTQRLSRKDLDARARAENFLANVPKSELKYYAEIANILESIEEGNHPSQQYDAAELKKEVSRALSQKKVSFIQKNESSPIGLPGTGGLGQRFTTPPNSPNISIAALRLNQPGGLLQPRGSKRKEQELKKISSNRFKRLQIQWELLSKDSSMMLKDLACEQETKSGGSTPTSANAAHKSRIPRPVSYPAGKKPINSTPESPSSNLRAMQDPKCLRSPSRLIPPKRYSVPAPSPAISTPHHQPAVTTPTPAPRARTPNSRAGANNSGSHPTTPKRRVQSPRTISRGR